MATEVPVDLAFGLLTALLTAAVFIDVLWRIGGVADDPCLRHGLFVLPAYLVIAVVVYSATLTTAMLAICRHMPQAVEGKNQAEAELRSMASRLRAIDQGAHGAQDERSAELRGLRMVLNKVIHRWRDLERTDHALHPGLACQSSHRAGDRLDPLRAQLSARDDDPGRGRPGLGGLRRGSDGAELGRRQLSESCGMDGLGEPRVCPAARSGTGSTTGK